MAIKIVQLGTPREKNEGLRIGTVRRPPRGVRKEDFAKLNYYDVWFPNLSPCDELVKQAQASEDEKSWNTFKRKFLAELKSSAASKDLDLLAALSHQTDLSIGCYCENENHCHRSILKELLIQRGADVK
ncbi:MAG: DUF488 family protein [Bacteroidetes bacterium]|nr:DUF488 family protein [Bacteroidota bacterium]